MTEQELRLLNAALALYRNGHRKNETEIVSTAKIITEFANAARAFGTNLKVKE